SLEMAKAGFYFTGVGTTAVCYSCGVSESDWEGHSPQLLHRLLFRTCPHLIGLDTTIKARTVVPGEVSKSTACALPPVPFEADPHDGIMLFKEDNLESPPTKKAVGQFPEVFEEMVVPLTIYVRIEKPTSNTLLDFHGYLVMMRKEEERLKSFEIGGWFRKKPSKETLAANGFFHLLIPEYTQCAFCLCVVHLWENKDVAQFHKDNSPNCPFINNKAVGNVPKVKLPADRLS
ncbi:hypothetical protein B4U80_12547, partial [Leptotrombidium deliense]